MKKSYALAGIMILAAVLLVLPVGAKAEMYVEGYIGGNFAANAGDRMDGSWTAPGNPIWAFTYDPRGNIDPAFQGGLKIGTWFVKEGFLGFNYPAWMRFLGFYLDFCYHRVDFRRQTGTYNDPFWVSSPLDFFSEGNAATLAFMFAARYGFLPDSEVPFGRLQPYVAVGPAILFSSQRPSIYAPLGNPLFGYGLKGHSRSSADICLAVEAGLRWMALKNVSIDVSYKYRYANPSYHYTAQDVTGAYYDWTFSPTFNFHSIQVGAAYHF